MWIPGQRRVLEHGIHRNPIILNLQDPFIHRHRTQSTATYFLASYDTQRGVGDQILTRVPTGRIGKDYIIVNLYGSFGCSKANFEIRSEQVTEEIIS